MSLLILCLKKWGPNIFAFSNQYYSVTLCKILYQNHLKLRAHCKIIYSKAFYYIIHFMIKCKHFITELEKFENAKIFGDHLDSILIN